MNTFSKKIVTLGLIAACAFGQPILTFAEETSSTTPETVLTTPVETQTGTTTENALVASTTPIIETQTTDAAEAPETSAASTTASTTPALPDVISETANAATTTNDLVVEAATGDNTASTSASSTIQTGDALGSAQVTNIVNVNVFNSDALVGFLNRMSNGSGDVDLRDMDSFLSCVDCAVGTTSLENQTSVQASSTNTAVIENAVIVRSSTGGNVASSSKGAHIQTGDAYASANVVNAVNAQFVDSRYVMLVFNNYGALNGDIVLPGESFFDQFIRPEMRSSTAPIVSVNASNTAEVATEIFAAAETGSNQATSTGTSSVMTGDAVTGTTITNAINQNHINTDSVALVFRVFGKWSGALYNVPRQFMWRGTPVGIEFLSQPPLEAQSAGGELAASTTNTAKILNSIDVSATTGGNSASGLESSISTGNAYATANVVNLVNTNVIGSNWMSAIINIFGDWNGNLSFGQPDLWVGTRASFEGGYAGPGGAVNFHYTVKNNGDAPVHSVRLTHALDSSFIELAEADRSIDVGTLLPGQMFEFDRRAHISRGAPFGYTLVENTITVTGNEPDGNFEDNTDTLSVMIANPAPQIFISYPAVDPARFELKNTLSASSSEIFASSTVDYTVSIKNVGGYTDNAVLEDSIQSETGSEIYSEQWNLGEVQAGEEITITYSVFFSASTTEGVYTNSARVRSYLNGARNESEVATSSVRVKKRPESLPKPTAEIKKSQAKVLGISVSKTKPNLKSGTTTSSAATTSATTTTPLAAQLTQSSNDGEWMLAGAAGAFITLPWFWLWLILVLLVAGAYYSARRMRVQEERVEAERRLL